MTSPVQAKPANTERHVWLDALRGWAMVAIVMVHAEQASRKGLLPDAPLAGFVTEFMEFLFYSIPLIFIVSAYAVALTLWIHVKKYGTSPRSFLAWGTRRMFRIAPMYYVAIGLYVVIHFLMSVYFNYKAIPTFGDLLANALFVHTWVPSAHNIAVPGGWTVSVEVMFYLLAPLIVLFAKWPLRFEFGLVVASIASLVLTYSLNGGDIALDTYFYHWFPTHFTSFAIGFIVFRRVLANEMKKPGASKLRWPQLALAAGYALEGWWLGTYGEHSVLLAQVLYGVSCAYLSIAVCGTSGNLIVNRVMVYFGTYSYSIYLLHYIFVLAAIFGVANWGYMLPENALLRLLCVFVPVMIASSLVAQISFRLIEMPGMAWGRVVADRIFNQANRTDRGTVHPAQ